MTFLGSIMSRGDVGGLRFTGVIISFAFVFVNFFLFKVPIFVILGFFKEGVLFTLPYALLAQFWGSWMGLEWVLNGSWMGLEWVLNGVLDGSWVKGTWWTGTWKCPWGSGLDRDLGELILGKSLFGSWKLSNWWRVLNLEVSQIKPCCNLLFLYFWKAFSLVSFILVFVEGLLGELGGSCCYEMYCKVNHGTFQALE